MKWVKLNEKRKKMKKIEEFLFKHTWVYKSRSAFPLTHIGANRMKTSWTRKGKNTEKDMRFLSNIHESINDVLLTQEPEKELNVKMFVMNGWSSEDEPPDTSSMITLVAKVEKWQQQSGNGAITVMCRYVTQSHHHRLVGKTSFDDYTFLQFPATSWNHS